MKLGRYSDSQVTSNFLQTSHKLAKSIHNSLPKNPEASYDSALKLPNLSNMRKSITSFASVTTERNTRNQLNNISHKLEELQGDLHNTRMDANVTLTLSSKP